jgi:lipid-A-disaccharide synthase-like uncharacterized protein
VSGWKLLGFAGTGLFASRWVIQAIIARRRGKSVVTPTFWLVTLSGSLLLIAYFGVSPHADPVGLLSNTLPFFVATYNLILASRSRRGTDGG